MLTVKFYHTHKGVQMKTVGLLLAVALFAVFAQSTSAQSKYDSRNIKMKVAGTSTLHDWECPVNKAYVKADLTINNNEIQSINSVWMDAEVKSIKSGKDGMDEKIYDTFDADKNPKITFQFTKTKSIEKNGDVWNITVSGNMTMGGTTMPVDLVVKAKMLPNGDVEISGTKKLKMTTFKMDPPSAMLGVVKSGDDVTISFTVDLKKL